MFLPSNIGKSSLRTRRGNFVKDHIIGKRIDELVICLTDSKGEINWEQWGFESLGGPHKPNIIREII